MNTSEKRRSLAAVRSGGDIAAVAEARHKPLSLQSIELEAPRSEEVRVRIVATGVCHTDISMRDQLYPVPQPLVLGHEGAGIVAEVGAGVTRFAVGDHVVMTFNSCDVCPSCRAHQPHYCHDFFARNFGGSRPDGSSPVSGVDGSIPANFFGQSSFATHAICLEKNLVKVPQDVDLALLGPLACGVMTGAGAIFNVLRPGAGESVVIFGAGSVGLSAVMAARLTAATMIIAVDLDEGRLALAASLGATHTINAKQEDPIDRVIAITGFGADRILEATGQPVVVKQAASCLAPRGMLGIVGGSPIDAEVSLNLVSMMTGGRVIRGIVEGEANPATFIPALVELHRQGRFPFDRLIRFYDFEDINQAIEDSETGVTIKAVLRMSKKTAK